MCYMLYSFHGFTTFSEVVHLIVLVCNAKPMQDLKNLRPQLYSAAEYCEKSYLHSEEKQM